MASEPCLEYINTAFSHERDENMHGKISSVLCLPSLQEEMLNYINNKKQGDLTVTTELFIARGLEIKKKGN